MKFPVFGFPAAQREQFRADISRRLGMHVYTAEELRERTSALLANSRSSVPSRTARTILGLAVPWNSLSAWISHPEHGRFRERFEPGAFTASLRSNCTNVRLLSGHRAPQAIASTRDGGLTVFEGYSGLRFEVTTDSNEGRLSAREIEAGIYSGASILFEPIRAHWETSKDGESVRVVTVASLDHIALTPNPAYRDTWVQQRSAT
jgi:HK97 family phage prohead protease